MLRVSKPTLKHGDWGEEIDEKSITVISLALKEYFRHMDYLPDFSGQHEVNNAEML